MIKTNIISYVKKFLIKNFIFFVKKKFLCISNFFFYICYNNKIYLK
ncbi:hypothetical protein [Candidatus Carsonella ruddii]|uniref:Uncharacterized protein n=1 Tax=Candidatus Carsonella ruddii PC isolate NHV TaxID=1202540 RepID=J3YQK7_CARRU|nr:hypothetical protein [Candidatus Carsonella ruddii]AFP84243.1 hypothetical protein A357_016 [Candidatus Carsonella ruddii PC isolate NHV]